MPWPSISPYSSDAPRCGQCSFKRPTVPLRSRNTTSSSPRILTRWGRSFSSSDKQIGCQKRRKYSPHGVSGPTCESSASSAGTSRWRYPPYRVVRNAALATMVVLLNNWRGVPGIFDGSARMQFVTSNDFMDHKGEELLGKVWIEFAH